MFLPPYLRPNPRPEEEQQVDRERSWGETSKSCSEPTPLSPAVSTLAPPSRGLFLSPQGGQFLGLLGMWGQAWRLLPACRKSSWGALRSGEFSAFFLWPFLLLWRDQQGGGKFASNTDNSSCYWTIILSQVLCFAGDMYLLIKPFTSVTGFLVIILQMKKLRFVEIM